MSGIVGICLELLGYVWNCEDISEVPGICLKFRGYASCCEGYV